MTSDDLIEFVRLNLPEFYSACRHESADTILMHRDAFGNSTEELMLLGAAIKCAGLYDKHIHVVANRQIQCALHSQGKD